jgi:hypothetical protein
MAELADAARLDGAYRDSRKRSPAKVAIRDLLGGLPAQHLVLRPQGNARKLRLEEAQASQKSREEEAVVDGDHREATLAGAPHRFRRGEPDGVAIEYTLRHHVASARVPRVVLPPLKWASGPQRPVDVVHGRIPFRQRDVVKHAVAIHQVNGLVERVLVEGQKTAVFPAVVRPRIGE